MLSKHLAISWILSALSPIVHVLLWESLTLWHMSTIRSPFYKSAYYTYFPYNADCLSLIFHLDYTRWYRLLFSHIGKRKPMTLRKKLHEYHDYITNIIKKYTWLMAWQWCHFVLVSHRSVAMGHLNWIALNWKLLHKSERGCKFSNRFKLKSRKKEKA